MLAVNHVTLATAITFGGSIYLDEPFFLPFIAFVVFASLLPDVDHPGSEISKFFPLINKTLPHRGVTHSIFGASVFMIALHFLINHSRAMSVVLLIFSFIGIYYLGKLLKKRLNQLQNRSKNFISEKQIQFTIKAVTRILDIFLLILAILIWRGEYRQEIITLLGVGYIGHIAGDWITKDGIPLFWPLKTRAKLKLFRTGGSVEAFVGVIIIGLNIYLINEFWHLYDVGSKTYWTDYLPFLKNLIN